MEQTILPQDSKPRYNSQQTVLFMIMAAGLFLSLVTGTLGYYLGTKKTAPAALPSPTKSLPEPTREEGVFCTMDAKLCPDGSAVGRIPPKCEFAPCPGGPTKPSSAPENSTPPQGSESVDFSSCKKGSGFNEAVGFGSTSLEVLEDKNTSCTVRIKNETEGGYTISQCAVPKNLGTVTFQIGNAGADFSSIEKYCNSKTQGNVEFGN